MRAIKERIFTFSLLLPLLLTSSLDTPKAKKETAMNADLQEVVYGYKHSRNGYDVLFAAIKHGTRSEKIPYWKTFHSFVQNANRKHLSMYNT